MFKSIFSKLTATLFFAFLAMLALLLTSINWMLSNFELGKFTIELAMCIILYGIIIGFTISLILTRRLNELAEAMETFHQSDFKTVVKIKASALKGDEVDRLAYVFEQMETRMMEQLQNLQNVDTQRRELLANISHDLRTPLASMRGYLETLLLKEGQLTPEELHYYLGVATKQSERLSNMIGDLFHLTKLDANDVILNVEMFPLNELVQDVVQKFLLLGEKRGIRIEVDFTESLPQVRADISLIERVLENLIGNALRYTDSGGLVRVTLSSNYEKVTICVSDTGRGMEADQIDKIFDRYYRADRSKDSDSGHAGLGLAITQRIIKLHGSNIVVESQRGVGTRFSFDLPIASVRD